MHNRATCPGNMDCMKCMFMCARARTRLTATSGVVFIVFDVVYVVVVNCPVRRGIGWPWRSWGVGGAVEVVVFRRATGYGLRRSLFGVHQIAFTSALLSNRCDRRSARRDTHTHTHFYDEIAHIYNKSRSICSPILAVSAREYRECCDTAQ